jgi:hypothetical protein
MSNLTANNQRSQLRALPVRGGKGVIAYCYAVRIPGGWARLTTALPNGLWGTLLQREGSRMTQQINNPFKKAITPAVINGIVTMSSREIAELTGKNTAMS